VRKGRYNQIAEPFAWNFTRADLAAVLDRLDAHDDNMPLATAA